MIRVVVSFFLSFYYRHVTVQLCIRVCEIHTIYIYRSLYCLYLDAVLISARRLFALLSQSSFTYPPNPTKIIGDRARVEISAEKERTCQSANQRRGILVQDTCVWRILSHNHRSNYCSPV